MQLPRGRPHSCSRMFPGPREISHTEWVAETQGALGYPCGAPDSVTDWKDQPTAPVPCPAPAFSWAKVDAVNVLFLFCCHPRIVIATWRPCPFRFRRSCSWTAPSRTRTTTCTRTWPRTRPTWCSRRRPSDCRWPRWPLTLPLPPPSWLPLPLRRPPARTPASRISDWKPKSTRPLWVCDANASAYVAPPAQCAAYSPSVPRCFSVTRSGPLEPSLFLLSWSPLACFRILNTEGRTLRGTRDPTRHTNSVTPDPFIYPRAYLEFSFVGAGLGKSGEKLDKEVQRRRSVLMAKLQWWTGAEIKILLNKNEQKKKKETEKEKGDLFLLVGRNWNRREN